MHTYIHAIKIVFIAHITVNLYPLFCAFFRIPTFSFVPVLAVWFADVCKLAQGGQRHKLWAEKECHLPVLLALRYSILTHSSSHRFRYSSLHALHVYTRTKTGFFLARDGEITVVSSLKLALFILPTCLLWFILTCSPVLQKGILNYRTATSLQNHGKN